MINFYNINPACSGNLSYRKNSNKHHYETRSSQKYDQIYFAGKNITLRYVLEKIGPDAFPQKVLKKVNEFVAKIPEANWPTLHDLHFQEYKPLLECRTLDEAKSLFPEFRDVQCLTQTKVKANSFLDRVKKGEIEGIRPEDFTLLMLKKIYGEVKPTVSSGDYFGLSSDGVRKVLARVNVKPLHARYSNYLQMSDQFKHSQLVQKRQAYWQIPENCKKMSETKKQYIAEHPEELDRLFQMQENHWATPGAREEQSKLKTLQYQSEELREKLSIATTKYFEEHPEARIRVSERNIRNFSDPEFRKRLSEIKLKFYQDNPTFARENAKRIAAFWERHPERCQEMSDYMKKVWENLPEMRQYMKDLAVKFPGLKGVLHKMRTGQPIKAKEWAYYHTFHKELWKQHPELKQQYADTLRKVREEMKPQN